MPNIKIKFDGIMLLTLSIAGAGFYLYSQRAAIAGAVDPTSQDNIFNEAAEGVVGVDNLQTVLTPAFELFDWAFVDDE